jgi:hypothetical protein
MVAKLLNIFKTLDTKNFISYDNDSTWDFFKKFNLLSILKFSIKNNFYSEQDFVRDLEESDLDKK